MARRSAKVVPFERRRGRGTRRPAPTSRLKERRRQRPDAWRLIAISVGLFVLVFVAGLLWPFELPAPGARSGASEPPAAKVVGVIDGDTLELTGGDRVRILNIDTAEMPPRSRCGRERKLALAAKVRLAELVEQGEIITLAREGRDRDPYGRQLRRVRIDGRDVGEQLVREGLAQPWRGHKADWC
jgi:micrococcal nuclease